MTGRYTAEGDVRETLAAVDDRFVVARPGDEVALGFDELAVPPLPAGWTRTFLLYADGYSKEMDLHSASPDRVEPMPFRSMRGYPPGDRAHSARPALALRLDTNHASGRVVPRPILSIDSYLLLSKLTPGSRPGLGSAGVAERPQIDGQGPGHLEQSR
jgi:hypothetical protein